MFRVWTQTIAGCQSLRLPAATDDHRSGLGCLARPRRIAAAGDVPDRDHRPAGRSAGLAGSIPYRIGQYAEHGIAARTGFLELNDKETSRKRDDAERQVPLTFYHDPQSLSSLPEQLQADLGKITASETLAGLDEATQISFGLGGRLPAHLRESAARWTPKDDAERQARYEALRRDLTAGGMETAQQHIDDIVGDFAQFIAR